MYHRFALFSNTISNIYRKIQKIEHDEMIKLGYKGAYAQYLVVLFQNPEGVTNKQLCDFCDINKAAVSRILTEMENQQLILRNRGYNAKITLTKKGENLAQYVCDKAALAVMEVSKEISSEQITLLYETLGEITKIVEYLSHKGLPQVHFNEGD